jgi:hypothetical protein
VLAEKHNIFSGETKIRCLCRIEEACFVQYGAVDLGGSSPEERVC